MRLRHYNVKTGNCGAVIISKQQLNEESISANTNNEGDKPAKPVGKTLEQLAIYQDKTILCEFKSQNESGWKTGDLNEVGLEISILKLAPKGTEINSKGTTEMEEKWGKVKFEGEKFNNKNIREITVVDLQNEIDKVFDIPPSRQTLARIHGAEIDFFCLGSAEKVLNQGKESNNNNSSTKQNAGLSLVEDLSLGDGSVLYIEDLKDPQVALITNVFPAPSLIRQKFEVEKNLITLHLFSPLFYNENNNDNSNSARQGGNFDVVSDHFKTEGVKAGSGTASILSSHRGNFSKSDEKNYGQIEIVVDQRTKLKDLRTKISELIGIQPETGKLIPSNEIEIHRKILKKEYKNDESTLSDLSLYEDSNLLVFRGIPALPNQFKSKLFLTNTKLPSHSSNLSLVSDKFAVSQNWTIVQFKKEVAKMLGLKQEEYKRIRIRIKKKAGGYGEVLKGGQERVLTSIEEPLLDEMEWIVNVLEEDEDMDEEELLIEVRKWGKREEEGTEKRIGKWMRVGDLKLQVGEGRGEGVRVKKGMRSMILDWGDEDDGWEVADDELVSGRPLYLRDGDLVYWRDLYDVHWKREDLILIDDNDDHSGNGGGGGGGGNDKGSEDKKTVRKPSTRRKEPDLVIKTVYDVKI